MSRRHRGSNPFSLFAFQDIITSVSGIFIVMVLLLTLELVERSTANAPVAVERDLSEDVREAIARAERELVELKRQADQGDRLLREAALSSSDEVEASIASREREIERIQTDIMHAQSRSEQIAENARSAAVEQFDLRDELHEIERLEKEIKTLQKELSSEAKTDRPVFTLPRGLKKQGWLAVIQEGSIDIAPIGRAAKPIVFRDEPGLIIDSSAADRVMQWAVEQNEESLYLLLLVRPDGIATSHALQTDLDLRNIEFGFDLIEQDQKILDSERGAAP